tara:strand:+ start:427 stop:1161 length:735 start_codon:yes stop_codon:yes gene_type:complete
MENFNDILNQVKSLKKEITFYSPINDKELNIYPLSLKQQKDILENTFSTTLSLLYFNNCIYNIIKENFSGNIKDLDTIDRVSISLSLRNKISSLYKSEDVEVNLSDIIEKNKNKATFKSENVTSNEFTFRLKKPNLELDNKINNIVLRKYKNEKITEDNVNNVISDLYIYELVKFIDVLEFGENIIKVEENINNTVKILNEIDSNNFNKVFDYINKLREIETSLTKIPNSDDSISITPDFFIVR